MAGLGEGALDFGGDRGIHGGEQQPRRVPWLAFFHGQIRHRGGHAAGQVPGHGILVLLARGAVARAEPLQFEPRVALQEFDEMLAHHSGGAQDAYFDARLHNSFTMRM